MIDGRYNDVLGNTNVINKGNYNEIRGDRNIVHYGNNNIINGDGSFVSGHNNIIYWLNKESELGIYDSKLIILLIKKLKYIIVQ